jgi:hypothetical protein
MAAWVFDKCHCITLVEEAAILDGCIHVPPNTPVKQGVLPQFKPMFFEKIEF